MKNPAGVSLVVLCIQLGWARGQDKLEQSPSTLRIQEGENIALNCSYSVGNFNGLLWYRQYPGEGPVLLFQMFSDGNEKNEGRTTASLDKTKSHSSLYIMASQPGDSATYFCAMTITGIGNLIWGTGTRLQIHANIKDPQPALYQLTSPKSSDTSVCLLTDFDSSNTYTNGNDSTVLEMMTMESKSYGAVAWGSKSSFNCTNAFPQNIINLTQPSGSTCKVQDVEQSFETDKDLNLMNASLIFLRVIFLKTVGFNLLMTLRLWSN